MLPLRKKISAVISILLILVFALHFTGTAYLGTQTESLINSSPLTPLATGYTPLDNLVKDFFNNNFKSNFSLYDKLKTCYDFLVYGSTYGNANTDSELYRSIYRECNYYSDSDTRYAAEAYAFIKTKTGSCNDFAAAFMVMARAIGFEAYVIEGTITWYAGTNPHVWCLIKIGSDFYSFDPQAEWRNYDNNGSVSYSNFCIKEGLQTSKEYNRDECIANFGNFKCINKTNEPGTFIPGTAENEQTVTSPSQTSAYKLGKYKTDDVMYFRSFHSTTASHYTLIPQGTVLVITELYGVWGKTEYEGNTGWLSLEYSTYITQIDSNTVPGDADGDKSVEASDARLVLRYSVALEEIKAEYLNNADINSDGKIDTSDARLILRKSVGINN